MTARLSLIPRKERVHIDRAYIVNALQAARQ
jgi:hypothetical protein